MLHESQPHQILYSAYKPAIEAFQKSMTPAKLEAGKKNSNLWAISWVSVRGPENEANGMKKINGNRMGDEIQEASLIRKRKQWGKDEGEEGWAPKQEDTEGGKWGGGRMRTTREGLRERGRSKRRISRALRQKFAAPTGTGAQPLPLPSSRAAWGAMNSRQLALLPPRPSPSPASLPSPLSHLPTSAERSSRRRSTQEALGSTRRRPCAAWMPRPLSRTKAPEGGGERAVATRGPRAEEGRTEEREARGGGRRNREEEEGNEEKAREGDGEWRRECKENWRKSASSWLVEKLTKAERWRQPIYWFSSNESLKVIEIFIRISGQFSCSERRFQNQKRDSNSAAIIETSRTRRQLKITIWYCNAACLCVLEFTISIR